MTEEIAHLFIMAMLTGMIMFVVYQTSKHVPRHDLKIESIKTESYSNSNPESIINMLNYIMDLELGFLIQIPFEGKDVKRITDFEQSLKDMTNNTAKALSEDFFMKAKLVGFNQDYILEYITRGCTVRLLQYIKDENAGYTPIKADEEE